MRLVTDSHVASLAGKFGTGIQSYFSFLRFLVVLNLVIFLIIFMLVLLPIILTKYKITNSTFVRIPFKDMGESKGCPSCNASFPVHLGSEPQATVRKDGPGYAAETNPIILSVSGCKH